MAKITSDEELDKAIAEIDELLRLNLTKSQETRLHSLGEAVIEYEDGRYPEFS